MGAIRFYDNSCIFIFVEIKIVVAHIGIISHPQIFYGYASTYSLLKERISPHYYFNNLIFVTIPMYKKNSEFFFLPHKTSSQRHLRQAGVMMRMNKHSSLYVQSMCLHKMCVFIKQ